MKLAGYGLLLLAALACGQDGSAQNAGAEMRHPAEDFELSITPNSLSISRNEPIEVQVSLKNVRDEPHTLRIRGSLTLEFTMFDLRPDGSRERSPGPTWARNPDHMYAGGEVTVEPGKTFRQPLVISEWIDSLPEGRHIIEIGWIEKPPVSVIPVFVTIDVGPRDETRLRQIVEELAAEALRKPRSLEESDRIETARAKLWSVHDEVLLPIAVRFSRDSWRQHEAIEKLKEFDSLEAVEAMGDIFRRNPNADWSLLVSRMSMLRSHSVRADVRQRIDEILKANPKPEPAAQRR